MTTPHQTLLLITRDRLVRADFARNNTLIKLWQQSNLIDSDDPSLQVEAALGLGPRPGKKVWVLSTELWTQLLSISGSASVSLSDEDLARALGFEVEPLSGIGVIESALGKKLIRRSGREQQFWITQGRSGDLERIDEAVRAHKSQLAGVIHPGGLPRPLSDVGTNSWQRVELWPNAIVCLYAAGDVAPRLLVINADPQEGRWRGEKEQWEKTVGDADRHEILLTTGELVTYRRGDEPGAGQDADANITAWLTLWAEQLASGAEVPVIRPARRPLSANQRGLIMAAVLMLAVGLCAAHHLTVTSVLMPPRNAELQLLNAQVAEKKAFDSQKKVNDKKRDELDREIAELRTKVDTCEAALSSHRWRLAKLLASLADDRPSDLLVEKIAAESAGPHVFGVAVDARQPNQYAARLNEKLYPLGWQAHLASQQFSKQKGMYEFAIALEDVAVPITESTTSKIPLPKPVPPVTRTNTASNFREAP